MCIGTCTVGNSTPMTSFRNFDSLTVITVMNRKELGLDSGLTEGLEVGLGHTF